DKNRRLDVLQEANCVMTQLLRDHTLVFKGTSAVHFGHWLDEVWYCRCCDAWRRLQSSRPLRHQTTDTDLDTLPGPDDRNESAGELFELISQVKDPLTTSVLTDRALGLTIRESALKRGLSKSYVGDLLRAGIEEIRM